MFLSKFTHYFFRGKKVAQKLGLLLPKVHKQLPNGRKFGKSSHPAFPCQAHCSSAIAFKNIFLLKLKRFRKKSGIFVLASGLPDFS
jgi:hypothetical protein